MEQILIEFLKDNFFKNNWFDEQALRENKYKYFQDLELLLAKVGSQICEFYTFLLLSGEYSKIDLEELNKLNEEISQYLFLELSNLSLEKNETDEDIELLSIIQGIFKEYTFDALNNFIFPYFYNLMKDVKFQFSFDNKYKLNSKNNTQLSQYSEPEFTNHLKIFISAIKITRIEHFEYKYTRETVQLLHSLRNDIDSLRSDMDSTLTDALLVKINFLFKKFLYRNELELTENRYTQFIGDLQSEEEFTTEKFKLIPAFNKWEERIRCHYELINVWRDKIKSYEKNLPHNHDRKLSFQDFHVLTKNYKDISKRKERLEILLQEFRSNRSKNKLDDFSLYAYSVSSSYIFNNVLSSTLENERNYSPDIIRDLVKLVEDQQEKTSVKNFFPWYKIANHLSEEMEKVSKTLFKTEEYAVFDEYVEIFKSILIKYEDCLEWSLNKNYLPFQFPFEECFSEYYFRLKLNNEEYPLFFFTSYILPSNYSFHKSEFLKINNKKIKTEALGEVYKSIQNLVDEVKINSDKVNNAERRSIEILGIFSAVALFSIGSIQIFGFETIALDPNIFYKFIATYGYSLGLFVLLIWMITRQHIKDVTRFHWFILAVFTFGTALLIYIFTSSVNIKNNLPNLKSNQIKPDELFNPGDSTQTLEKINIPSDLNK